MSRLPRKKSRPIEVEGSKYRYLIRGKNRYIGRAPGAVSISIQEDVENPGQTLQCIAVSSMADASEDENGDCTTSIYPSDIEKIIRTGLERGWDPRDGQGSFALGDIKLKEYSCSSFVISPFGWYPNK